MRRLFAFSLISALLLLVGPALWADAGLDAPAGPAVDTAAETGEQAPRPLLPRTALVPSLDEALDDHDKTFSSCSATYPCVHGGSVNCSAPTGTCSSSGARCGSVTCNGTMTACPGTCMHAFNCANFCYTNYGSTDGDCDSFGCCVCY